MTKTETAMLLIIVAVVVLAFIVILGPTVTNIFNNLIRILQQL
jgi:Flp pilus assembly pilin Flp